jgi:hypothetical protein
LGWWWIVCGICCASIVDVCDRCLGTHSAHNGLLLYLLLSLLVIVVAFHLLSFSLLSLLLLLLLLLLVFIFYCYRHCYCAFIVIVTLIEREERRVPLALIKTQARLSTHAQTRSPHTEAREVKYKPTNQSASLYIFVNLDDQGRYFAIGNHQSTACCPRSNEVNTLATPMSDTNVTVFE